MSTERRDPWFSIRIIASSHRGVIFRKKISVVRLLPIRSIQIVTLSLSLPLHCVISSYDVIVSIRYVVAYWESVRSMHNLPRIICFRIDLSAFIILIFFTCFVPLRLVSRRITIQFFFLYFLWRWCCDRLYRFVSSLWVWSSNADVTVV